MIDPKDASAIAAPLLEFVRQRSGSASARYAEPPARLFGGNHTFVHGFALEHACPDWDGAHVVRILRSHRGADEVVFESAVQNALAESGALAPRVLLWETDPTSLGGAFQVMRRVAGSALVLGDVGPDVSGLAFAVRILASFRRTAFGSWPEQLAEAHARVHDCDPAALSRALDELGLADRARLGPKLDRIVSDTEALDQPDLRRAASWLVDHQPRSDNGHVICHGDLFPNQVFAHGNELSGIIDWADAMLAPAEMDVGIAAAGLATVPVGIPGAVVLQRRVVRRFLEAYAKRRPIDDVRLGFAEIYRGVTSLLAIARFRAGTGPAPVPYDGSKGAPSLIRYLAERGLKIRLR